jgi:hypothetical protein
MSWNWMMAWAVRLPSRSAARRSAAQLPAAPGDWPAGAGPTDRRLVGDQAVERVARGRRNCSGRPRSWAALFRSAVAAGRVYLIGSRAARSLSWLWTPKTARNSGPRSWVPSASRTSGPVTPDEVHTHGGRRPHLRPGLRRRPGLPGQGRQGQFSASTPQRPGGSSGTWAYAESPLIDGDVLVCTPGGGKATLAALNKKTGEVIWKAEVPSGGEAHYSSAIVTEAGGVRRTCSCSAAAW